MRVEIGFIATRTTSGSPVVIPPSSPPALLRAPAEPAPEVAAVRRHLVAVGIDRIVHRGAGPAGRLEAEPDLDALHRGNRHQHPGEPAVELPVPAHVAAEPEHDAARHHLDLAAQRVAGLLGLRRCGAMISRFDARDRAPAPRDRSAASLSGVGSGSGAVARIPPSDTTWLPISTPNSSSSRRARAPAATRAVGLPGAGALEDVPGVEPVVLEHADQVGVARPRPGHPAAPDLARSPPRAP